MNRKFLRMAAAVAWVLALVGCGDLTSANGEFGRVNYALHTDFEVEGTSLTETSLLVGHAQVIHTSPLNSEDYAEDDQISHVVTPEEGVTVVQGAYEGAGDPWKFEVLVETPGTYVFETWKAETLHDRLEVEFDVPATLDLVAWARAPWEDDFQSLDQGESVEEGTQVAFLPIPLDASGNRIAGDLFAQLEVSEPGMIIPGANVWGVYEQSIWASTSPSSVYFIDEGEVDVSLVDVPNAVAATWSFVVTSSVSE